MADKTAQELCEAALRKNRAIDPGQTAPAQDLADTFEEMLRMLNAWAAKNTLVYVGIEDTHTLVGGTQSYTIGPGADINTARPVIIRSAFVRESGLDHPIKIVGEAKYNTYQQKGVGYDYPSSLWYKPTYPNGTIYLWPPGGGVLHLFSQKRLAEPATVSNDMVFPEEGQDAIVWNLACRIAPEYIGDPTAYMLKMADDSLQVLEDINEANDLAEADMDIRLMDPGLTTYDIDGG